MPTLMQPGRHRATLDGLKVSTEMEESPYLWASTDDTVLGEPCNSSLVMRRGQRFESARRISSFRLYMPNFRYRKEPRL